MQLLILSLLVAAASATYEYSYPQSYSLGSYGGSLYGGYGGYGYGNAGSYGYGGLGGSGVSYLLGGHEHGSSHYTPSIHFIRYIPSHTALMPPKRGKVDFVMRPSKREGGGTNKSTQKGPSSVQSYNPPPPVWISSKGGNFQSKASDSSKTISQGKTNLKPTDLPKTPNNAQPKPVTQKTTEASTTVTPSMPEDVSVTTEFPEDFTDDSVFIEDEPENEAAERPIRPEPLIVGKPKSNLINERINSKPKTFVPVSINKHKSPVSASYPKTAADTNLIPKSDSNAKTAISSKADSFNSHPSNAANSKINTSKTNFVPVPDMDYDDFGSASHAKSNVPKKEPGRVFVENNTPIIQETINNKRPLATQLMGQTFSVLTSSFIVPEIIVQNPAIDYYYENQPAIITYGYGIPMEVIVAK